MAARERHDYRQNLVHPWGRPRTVGGKKALHVHTEMDAALGQRNREQVVAHQGAALWMGSTSSAYVQKNGLAIGDHNTISSAMRKHRTGERRDIRDRAMRGVGLVFADNLEALFAPILSHPLGAR